MSALESWWRGRYGRRLLVEIVVLFALLTLYRLGRYFGRDEVDDAFRHARQVLDLEHRLGIANERGLQQSLIEHVGLIKFLNNYYATVHFPATVAFLVLVYVKAPVVYQRVRFVIVSVSLVALVMHIAYPLAPPRMLSGFRRHAGAAGGPEIYSRARCGQRGQPVRSDAVAPRWVGADHRLRHVPVDAAPVALDRGEPRRRHVDRRGRHREPLLARRPGGARAGDPGRRRRDPP